MSITHARGDYVFLCDGAGCQSILNTHTSNWDSAQNIRRREKWLARKLTGNHSKAHHLEEWEHLCPTCQNGARLPLAHGKTRSENAGAP